ncbi:MAG: c-type cytochrome [Chromatiales bacterium]
MSSTNGSHVSITAALAMAAVLVLSACSQGEDQQAPSAMPDEPTMKGEATTAEGQAAAPAMDAGETAAAESAPAGDQSGMEEDTASGSAMEEMKTAAGAAMDDMKAAAEGMQASAESAMASATESSGRAPEKIYQTYCQACHMSGVAGAPKLGDSAAWAPRIAKGMDTLVTHAVNGLNAMPPKGTCMDCSEAEIKATVEYMTSQSQ